VSASASVKVSIKVSDVERPRLTPEMERRSAEIAVRSDELHKRAIDRLVGSGEEAVAMRPPDLNLFSRDSS
jgi:hypothetical protein